MAILGAHMSITGGYHRSVERARAAGCDCVQIFTKNNSQWKAKPISDEEAQAFRTSLASFRIVHPLSHSSYLINLASPNRELRNKSIEAFAIELQRAEQLGIPYVVLHPGAYISGTDRGGLRRVIQSLNSVHKVVDFRHARCLLENTAGQGTTLGWRFEQLARILDDVTASERLAICVDTCHLCAAGYPLGTKEEYRTTMREIQRTVGLKQIRAFHLNDSKREFGSRVDRHEHIGRGHLGLDPFRFLLNDRRFRNIPMYLETPKGQEKGRDLDRINLRTLRRLIDR